MPPEDALEERITDKRRWCVCVRGQVGTHVLARFGALRDLRADHCAHGDQFGTDPPLAENVPYKGAIGALPCSRRTKEKQEPLA